MVSRVLKGTPMARRNIRARGANRVRRASSVRLAENKSSFIDDIVDSMIRNGEGRYDWLNTDFSYDENEEMFYYMGKRTQSYSGDSLFGIVLDFGAYLKACL